MAEPAVVTQSTEPESQIDPANAEPAFEVRLTAVRSGAKVLRSGGIEIEVQQAQAVGIQADDGIEVVKLEEQEEQSYSILDFSDYLEVELFSNTKVFLADLQPEAGGSTDVILDLDRGNMFVHLNDQTTSQVTVQTQYAAINTLTAGTEFDVCHNAELTCVLVKRGVVEVMAQGRKQIVKAGEASQILKDQPPSPSICAPTEVFIAWEESYRQFADAPALEKGISELPQDPCPVTTLRIPVNARILYRNEFTNAASGWARGKIDNFIVSYVRYSGRKYYQVQAEGPDKPYLAYVPNEREYGDVNVDVRAIAEAASDGDFRYGPVFRRSGDQYYAFVISPRTDTWYFLKSSSAGLEVLRDGTDKRMRGLDTREVLRVESYGSTFLLFINGRFIDWISDPDYASGEVGLFVDSKDNPDALIRFDSIIIWDIPPVTLIPDTGGREYCFNASDDDADRLIDRADPDCQRREITLILTSLPTSLPLSTNTLRPTNTLTPQSTITRRPTNTLTPRPTVTRRPTLTPTPRPTNTRRSTVTPIPLPTNTRRPTLTPTPRPTDTRRPTLTPIPLPTNTRRPPATSTPRPTNPPAPTDTRRPTLTSTPRPTNPPAPTDTQRPPATPTLRPTNPPAPTDTSQPEPTATDPPEPTATDPPEPTATDPPEPTATEPPTTLIQLGAGRLGARVPVVDEWGSQSRLAALHESHHLR